MFDGPEYASYIALCRELRLERKLKIDDQISVWFDNPSSPSSSNIYLVTDEDETRGWGSYTPVDQSDFVDGRANVRWLPRLDQWLAMLEKAAPDWTNTFSITRHEDGEFWATFEGRAASNGGSWDGLGPTREEAAARLWMAVTGHSSQLTDPVSSS